MALIDNLAHMIHAATGPAPGASGERRVVGGGWSDSPPSTHHTPPSMGGTVHDGAGSREEQQLWHGQKLETLGRLAAGIAHDFNNLLTVVLGYSEMLANHLGADDPRRDLVAEIQKAGTQAERLTRQIVGFAGPQALEPQVLDLGAVLANTEKMLRRLIGSNVILGTVAWPTLWPTKIDRGQIQQVLVNLAVNARDAMPRGGTMTIEIANVTVGETASPARESLRKGDGETLRVGDGEPARKPVPPGSYVMLSVQDTGIGMSALTKARIFEPFFTTKALGNGTGLGLAMVDDIIQQNGGHIDVQSELGRGTTFRIYLPRAQEPAAAPAPCVPADDADLPGGNEVVLLVEDEVAVRHLSRQILQMCGYKVLEATDGKQALRIVADCEGPIHLLLSDVVMPHIGGCQLAAAIRARHPQLKVLFLSGHPIDFVLDQGVQESEFAFLQKPFTVGALAHKVREVLNSTNSPPPELNKDLYSA